MRGAWHLLLALLPWTAAFAQGLEYRVDINAPREVAGLLRDNLAVARWQESGNMRLEQLRALVRLAPQNAKELLAAQGYFRPEVDAKLVQDGETWVARVDVDPGARARVDTVEIAFTGAVSDDPQEAARRRRLRKEWLLAPGSPFDQKAWERAKRTLLRGLLSDRYPAARITTSEARVDPEAASVAIRIELDSGPPYRFGELRVTGLERYSRDLIERFDPIKPGDVYQQNALAQFQRKLLDSGYFETAYASVELGQAQGERLPVDVQVKEKPSQRLAFGVGASSDTGARLQIHYDDRDVLERAWRFASELKLETRRQNANVRLMLPPRLNGDRFAFGSTLERTDLRGQTTRNLVVNAERIRIDGDIERKVGIEYTLERQSIAGLGSTYNRAAYPSYTWTRRNLDQPIDPRSGTILEGEVGGAAKALLSTQDFLRLHGRAAALISPGAKHTFTFRGELGSVLAKSRDGIPSRYLWRTGGDNSVRGYAFESIGVASGEAIVGGRYVAVASAQYLYRFTDKWGGVVFYDVGDAADSISELRWFQGVGIGGRYTTPVGAVGLDVAYGIERRRVRLHFSLGFTF